MTQFAELKLLPGASMRITLSGSGDKSTAILAKYIGSLPSQAIVAAAPANPNLRAGTKVAVSMTSPTGIVTFASQIETAGTAPFAHLFLQWPDAVHVRNVRAAVRFNVGVSAQV